MPKPGPPADGAHFPAVQSTQDEADDQQALEGGAVWCEAAEYYEVRFSNLLLSMEWITGFPASNKRVAFFTGKGRAIAAVGGMIWEKILPAMSFSQPFTLRVLFYRCFSNSSCMY